MPLGMTGPSSRATAAAAGVRGQRPGHQRADAERVGRRLVVDPSGTAVCRRRRHRSARRLRGDRRACRPGAHRAAPGDPPPAGGALRRPCRHRRRVGLSRRRQHSRRSSRRSDRRHRPSADHRRAGHFGRARPTDPRWPCCRAHEGSGADRLPSTGDRRAGDRAAGSTAAGNRCRSCCGRGAGAAPGERTSDRCRKTVHR